MAAKKQGKKGIKIYALDRVKELKITDQEYKFDNNFDPDDFFSSSYGIIVYNEYKVERVRIKVDAFQCNFIRSLPLHSTQKEIEKSSDYSIFEYFISPTIDFQQELSRYGSALEVLCPEWLRKDFAEDARHQHEKYSNKE